MEFELPEELRMFKETLRRFVNSELIPVERQTLTTEGEEIKPEFLGKLQQRAKDLGIWMMEVPEEYGGPGLSLLQRDHRHRGAVAHHRPAGARRRHHRPVGAPHPVHAQRRAAREISDAGAARREEGRLRADRARRRLRSRRHAHHRGEGRQPLRHQRHQALHHRRPQGGVHAAHGGDRPRQGLARRQLMLPGRHGHARREARHVLPDHDGRPALGDHPRQRAGAGREPRRRGRRRLRARRRSGSAPAA